MDATGDMVQEDIRQGPFRSFEQGVEGSFREGRKGPVDRGKDSQFCFRVGQSGCQLGCVDGSEEGAEVRLARDEVCHSEGFTGDHAANDVDYPVLGLEISFDDR